MKSFKHTTARAFVTLTTALALSAHALAEESADSAVQLPGVVVTAELVETPLNQIGSSVTVITRESIERSQKSTALELLRGAPGLDVVQSGPLGGATSVFIRGGGSEHTLVLIDGAKINDPASTNGAYDFSSLNSENIERIEILRGSQSALYGSDAIGGVINIITREGKGAPKFSALTEYGSFNSYRASASVAGSSERSSYALNLSRYNTDGISATSITNPGSEEKDSFERTAISGRLRRQLSSQLTAALTFRSINSENDFDKGYTSYSTGVRDDPNLSQQITQFYAQSRLTYQNPNQDWRITGSIGLAKHKRETVDLPDTVFGPGESSSLFDGERVTLRLQGVAEPANWNRLILGAETEREQMTESITGAFPTYLGGLNARVTSLYAVDRVSINDRLFLSAGLRHDDHEQFGGVTTYRLTGAYLVPETETRIRASYATGFNTPSLFQLYDPTYGNTNLGPEESVGWEIGFDQQVIEGRLSAGAVWFHTEFTDLFGFDPATFRSINIKEGESEGAEVYASYTAPRWQARFDYTYTKTVDLADGAQLIRRPKNKLSLSANMQLTETLNANLKLTHTGTRSDRNFDLFPAEVVTLESDPLVDLGASLKISERWSVFGRIENALDTDYQEVLFYQSPGRAAYFGVRLNP